jgi:hypothetical protein
MDVFLELNKFLSLNSKSHFEKEDFKGMWEKGKMMW